MNKYQIADAPGKSKSSIYDSQAASFGATPPDHKTDQLSGEFVVSQISFSNDQV